MAIRKETLDQTDFSDTVSPDAARLPLLDPLGILHHLGDIYPDRGGHPTESSRRLPAAIRRYKKNCV
jgi:hypothetical protein